MSHRPGKFWPWVRELIWAKAEELHAADFYESHEENITRPTRRELREAGYFHQAKCLVLSDINRTIRGAISQFHQEEADFRDYTERVGEQ